jgi:hypothetical protein
VPVLQGELVHRVETILARQRFQVSRLAPAFIFFSVGSPLQGDEFLTVKSIIVLTPAVEYRPGSFLRFEMAAGLVRVPSRSRWIVRCMLYNNTRLYVVRRDF